jgi:hypothetical protein
LKLKSLDKVDGLIINMLSTDVTRIEFGTLFIPHLVVSPLAAIAIVVLLVKLVDLTFLNGLVAFVLATPIQTLLAKLISHYKCLFLSPLILCISH